MMSSLFSIFDPSSSVNFNLLFLILFFPLFLMPKKYWMMPNFLSGAFLNLFNYLKNEFNPLFSKMKSKPGIILILSLFTLIMLWNIMGLLPYVFTSTSHMAISLSMALPFWFAIFMYSWLNDIEHALAHLVPLGTPNSLMLFMVLIELVSNLIRPITLMIRLSANMITGHLLISLLTSCNIDWHVIVSISVNFLLITLETAVAFIQAYVFAILMTLYLKEVYVHTKSYMPFSS